MDHVGFPSDETFAAFLDGRLDAETRGRVVEHLSSCDECYGLFESASELDLNDVPSPAPPPNVVWYRRYAKPLMGAAAAVMVIGLFATPFRDYFPYISRGSIPALVDASRSSQYRPSLTRLSGGFPYKPFRAVRRGTVDESEENPKLLSVTYLSQEVAARNPSVDHLHSAGVAYMLRGEMDKALRALSQAVIKETGVGDPVQAARKSKDSELLTDLSSAWYANKDKANAQVAIDRAWSLEKSPEIAWNRAVIVEALEPTRDAQLAWQEYLRLDPTSPWADEALKRLVYLAGR